MRSLALVLVLASSAFAAAPPPPLEFTLSWEQGEHSRDMSGSRSVFTLKGQELTKESRSWGHMAMMMGKEDGARKKTVKLTAAQLEELRALLAATEGLKDLRMPTKQDVHVIEATLTVPGAKAPRVLVLEAYPTNEHVRGLKGEILDPPDAGPSPSPAVKTYAAMNALYLKLLMLFPLEPL